MTVKKPPLSKAKHFQLKVHLPGTTGKPGEVRIELVDPDNTSAAALNQLRKQSRLCFIVGPWPPPLPAPHKASDEVPHCRFCGRADPLGN